MLLIWILVFIVSLVLLVKGADWLLKSSEKIGLAIGLSPFIVGVLIVGAGTSFPELVSSIVAVWQGATEIVAANAIGSNIANILLVIGIASVIGKKLTVSKSLINLDLPLLAITTVIFLGIVWDGQITRIESIFLLTAFIIYLAYTILHKDDTPLREELETLSTKHKPKIQPKDLVLLIIGSLSLTVGAKYLIDAVISISDIMGIAVGAITIIAVAIGTSLPEIIVSAKAALEGKSEVAVGNIFGSNIFNILVVTGVPGIFTTLHVDTPTLTIGVPALALATFLFVVSGISKKIHNWEGALFLLAYLLFMGKIFNLL